MAGNIRTTSKVVESVFSKHLSSILPSQTNCSRSRQLLSIAIAKSGNYDIGGFVTRVALFHTDVYSQTRNSTNNYSKQNSNKAPNGGSGHNVESSVSFSGAVTTSNSRTNPTVTSSRYNSSTSSNLSSNNGSSTNNGSRCINNSAPSTFCQSSIDRLNYLYNQPEVDLYASRPSVRLTPISMLYTGGSSDGVHLLRSAQYLQKELPVRVAHRITGFRHLPFIIAINPVLLSLQELYLRTFKILINAPPVRDSESEQQYCQLLRSLLNDHRDVVTLLASGFRDCSRYLTSETKTNNTNTLTDRYNRSMQSAMDMRTVRKFLDRMLTSRLGLRMLAEHHLGLHSPQDNFVGIVHTEFSLNKMANKWALWCKRLCEHTYGISPEIEVNGHLNATFPYIEMPLDYIIPELLKNALRSTVEQHREQYNSSGGSRSKKIPKVVVTIANNDTDFMIRISDRGGGVPSAIYDKIFHYNFSTVSDSNGTQLFDTIVEESNSGTGPMHGYGFGLPTCKAYAEYLGGSLAVENMYGIGCDVYLKLIHIDSKQEIFRI